MSTKSIFEVKFSDYFWFSENKYHFKSWRFLKFSIHYLTDGKSLTQNLTRCRNLDSNFDELFWSSLEVYQVLTLPVQNLTPCKNLINCDSFAKFGFENWCFFSKLLSQNLVFSRNSENAVFDVSAFWSYPKMIFLKKKFSTKIVSLETILIQNLMLCKYFDSKLSGGKKVDSKSDAL